MSVEWSQTAFQELQRIYEFHRTTNRRPQFSILFMMAKISTSLARLSAKQVSRKNVCQAMFFQPLPYVMFYRMVPNSVQILRILRMAPN